MREILLMIFGVFYGFVRIYIGFALVLLLRGVEKGFVGWLALMPVTNFLKATQPTLLTVIGLFIFLHIFYLMIFSKNDSEFFGELRSEFTFDEVMGKDN